VELIVIDENEAESAAFSIVIFFHFWPFLDLFKHFKDQMCLYFLFYRPDQNGSLNEKKLLLNAKKILEWKKYIFLNE